MHERHIAKVEVSPELVLKALHFPEGTEIFGVKYERGTHGYVVTFALEHPDLPAVDEAEIMPTIQPIMSYHRERWDFNWNAAADHGMVYDDVDTSEAYDALDYIDPYGDT